MAPLEPYDEDTAVCRLAERLDLELSRYEGIEIYDEAAIAQAGLMRQTPDYTKIRKALKDGVTVPGARTGPVEYKLKRRTHA